MVLAKFEAIESFYSHQHTRCLCHSMSELSWHDVALEKGAVAQVRINTVTIERKKFSEVYGVFRALYSSSRLFSIIFMFLTRI